MKLLIAYDGSDCAGAAIEDLSRAGLPEATEALIVTVTETWLPKDLKEESFGDTLGFASSETFKQMRAAAFEKIDEGEKLAESASLRVSQKFPAWQVRHKAVGGFPENEIVSEANKYKPDLIVIGSHGRGGVGRFVFGSVSLKVLSEAACPVRVTHGPNARIAEDDSPLRLVVAIDGSSDSRQAVKAVANRSWLPETSVRLLTAIEPSVLLQELPQAEKVRKEAAEKLKKMGLHVSCAEQKGRAKSVIVEEAEKWGADAIFIGAKGHRMLERVLLGSVSYAVAARAHCSVEVVRGAVNEKHTEL